MIYQIQIDGSEQEPVELIAEGVINKGDIVNISFSLENKKKYKVRMIEHDLDQWRRDGVQQICLDKTTIYLEEI